MKSLLEHKKRWIVIGMLLIPVLGIFLVRFNFSDTQDSKIRIGYLYNYDNQKIQIIEKKGSETNHRMLGYWNDKGNEFQYFFKEYDTTFTSGNSLSNQFSILEVSPSNVITRFRLESEEKAAFPLTKDQAGNLYFSVTSYANDGGETRTVSYYDQQANKLTDLGIKLTGLMDGCIINSILYLTAYNVKNDNYDLYQVSLEDTNQLFLIEESIDTYEIYNLNNELYLKNKQNRLKAYQSRKEYPAGNQTITYKDYLINLKISEEGVQDISVYSISKDDVLYQKKNIISFYIENDELLIYTKQTVSSFSLKG